jgi:hypothetical protein
MDFYRVDLTYLSVCHIFHSSACILHIHYKLMDFYEIQQRPVLTLVHAFIFLLEPNNNNSYITLISAQNTPLEVTLKACV